MLRQIILRLVSLLEIKPGPSYEQDRKPAEERVVSALMGESDHAVTIVDCGDYDGWKWVVLGAVPENSYLPQVPSLVMAPSHDGRKCNCIFCQEKVARLEKEKLPTDRLATMDEVAEFFRGRCDGLGEDTKEFSKTWAAGACESFAHVPIGGDLGGKKATTKDIRFMPNNYRWFDLNEVPTGGSVYRISRTPTLWLFTRREEGWEITVIPNLCWAHTAQEGLDFGTLLMGALHSLEVEALEVEAIN